MNEKTKYSGILLAAGNSSRMNSWKPGALIDNIPVLYYSLRTISSVCDDVVVVGGYNIEELKSLVRAFVIPKPVNDANVLPAKAGISVPESSDSGHSAPRNSGMTTGDVSIYRPKLSGTATSIICVENKSYNSGMFSSVKTGLSHTQNDTVFIALADMPFVSEQTYLKMTDRAENEYHNADVIYPIIISHSTENKYKKGHPVLIKKSVKDRILKESGDVVLRDILKEFAGQQCLVTDPGINFDIDTEEDFERAKNYYLHYKNTQEK